MRYTLENRKGNIINNQIQAVSSSRSSVGERSIGKASALEDNAIDFQRIFLFFLEEEDGIYASKVY